MRDVKCMPAKVLVYDLSPELVWLLRRYFDVICVNENRRLRRYQYVAQLVRETGITNILCTDNVECFTDQTLLAEALEAEQLDVTFTRLSPTERTARFEEFLRSCY